MFAEILSVNVYDVSYFINILYRMAFVDNSKLIITFILKKRQRKGKKDCKFIVSSGTPSERAASQYLPLSGPT